MNPFVAGGTVQALNGIYLKRAADTQLLNTCLEGQYAHVLTSRQVGKSSLMVATAAELRQARATVVLLDLSSIGKGNITEDRWYYSVLNQLTQQLTLNIRLATWWQEQQNLSNPDKFTMFLQSILLAQITQRIVIFLDEIDTLLSFNFRDDFFILLRSLYNNRPQYFEYHRLSFVLLGMATPDDLIGDKSRTPYNIGQEIVLEDFSLAECMTFQAVLVERYGVIAEQYFQEIYAYTQGHPYLTQQLSRAVYEQSQAVSVEAMVEQLFFNEGRVDSNIQFVENYVKNESRARELLTTYKKLLAGQADIPDDNSDVVNRLKLSGLVHPTPRKRLRIRNKIYRRYFNEAWVEELLGTQRVVLAGRYEYSEYTFIQDNDLIKHGTFASVYKAFDLETHEPVALKLLDRKYQRHDDFVNEFIAAAQLTRNLNHPNIIKVLDMQRGNNYTRPFMVMEYIAGGNLREYLQREKRLSVEMTVHIISQIGEALVYAHNNERVPQREHIIHRDVNPNNILLEGDTTPSNIEQLRPVLIDFEFARLSTTDAFVESTSVRGTDLYMAPEVSEGQVSSETDVFALAVTCYELLAGRGPLYASNVVILSEKYKTETKPNLSILVPHLGPFFDELLNRATLAQPSLRGRMRDFVRDLKQAAEKYQKLTAVLTQAQTAMTQQNYQAASLQLNQIAQVAPHWVNLLALQSQLAVAQGNGVEACRWVEQILAQYRQAYQEAQGYYAFGKKMHLDNHSIKQVYVYNRSVALYNLASTDYLGQLKKMIALSWGNQLFSQTVTYSQEFKQVFEQQPEGYLDDGRFQEMVQDVFPMSLAEATPRHHEAMIQLLTTVWLPHQQQLIRELKNSQGIQPTLIEPYANLDKFYQRLIELEPDQVTWLNERTQYLYERVTLWETLAEQALTQEDYYETTLKRYQNAIEDLGTILKLQQEKMGYNGVDVTQVALSRQYFTNHITMLEQKMNQYRKDAAILRLLGQNDMPIKEVTEKIAQHGLPYQDVIRVLLAKSEVEQKSTWSELMAQVDHQHQLEKSQHETELENQLQVIQRATLAKITQVVETIIMGLSVLAFFIVVGQAILPVDIAENIRGFMLFIFMGITLIALIPIFYRISIWRNQQEKRL